MGDLLSLTQKMNKLHDILAKEYPYLPWKETRNLRNLIVHDYGNIDIEQIYYIVLNDLPSLRKEFAELKNKNIS